MPSEGDYEYVQEFLRRMDAGKLDGDLIAEVGKLTDEQRDELARALIERDATKSNPSSHSAGSKG